MTIEECFEAAAQVEELMRDLYARLAELYDDAPAHAEAFRRLAREEEQHAMRVRLLSRHRTEGTWTTDTAAQIERSLGGISAQLVAMVADLHGSTREDRQGLLRRAMQAERSCSIVHAELLTRSAEIDVQVLFAALARQDTGHEELLAGLEDLAGHPGHAG